MIEMVMMMVVKTVQFRDQEDSDAYHGEYDGGGDDADGDDCLCIRCCISCLIC